MNSTNTIDCLFDESPAVEIVSIVIVAATQQSTIHRGEVFAWLMRVGKKQSAPTFFLYCSADLG